MLRSEQVTIDCLQYCNWSPKIFDQMAQGGVDAVHVTICYHEDYDEVLSNIKTWNTYFEKNKEFTDEFSNPTFMKDYSINETSGNITN